MVWIKRAVAVHMIVYMPQSQRNTSASCSEATWTHPGQPASLQLLQQSSRSAERDPALANDRGAPPHTQAPHWRRTPWAGPGAPHWCSTLWAGPRAPLGGGVAHRGQGLGRPWEEVAVMRATAPASRAPSSHSSPWLWAEGLKHVFSERWFILNTFLNLYLKIHE